MIKIVRSIACASILLLWISCAPDTEGPTRGSLNVVLEESIAPPLIRVIEQFNGLYGPNASVTYSIVSHETMLAGMDTMRLFFTAEYLHPALHPRAGASAISLIVAYDGVVAIVSEKNPAEHISTAKLAQLLSGKGKAWKSASTGSSSAEPIQLLVSANGLPAPYLQRRFGLTSPASGSNATSAEIVFAVERNPDALGLVGLGWVDSLGQNVKMLSVSRSKDDADTTFAPPATSYEKPFSPHLANIYLNYYPLKRAVWMVGRTTGKDVVAGFTAFVAGPEGQRILFQHNWLPATQKIKLKGVVE